MTYQNNIYKAYMGTDSLRKILYLHGGTYYGSTTQYVSYER